MSTVIMGAIVVIWLIVLVPMWLRRHDAALDERSSEKFEGAMRVLARRPLQAGVDRRYVVMPRRSAGTAVHVSGASAPVHSRRERELVMPAPVAARAPKSATATAVLPEPEFVAAPRVSGTSTAAARRRRSLLILLGLSVLTILLVVAGVMAWPLQLLPELLVIAFVVQSRVHARQAAVASRQRRRGAVAPSVAARLPQQRVSYVEDEQVFDQFTFTAKPVESTASFTPYDVFADTDLEAVTVRPAAPPVVPEPEVVVEPEPVAARTWEPKPVPRPTYQMKPAAPGPEFAYADDDEPLLEAEPAHDLDLILEHRRAVND